MLSTWKISKFYFTIRSKALILKGFNKPRSQPSIPIEEENSASLIIPGYPESTVGTAFL